MPLLKALRAYGDEARRALERGEELLALSPAAVAYGVTGGPSGAEPDVDAKREKVQRVVGAANGSHNKFARILLAPLGLFGAGPSIDVDVEKILGGRTCEGPGSSAARDVQQAVARCADALVAVTDRRLLVMDYRTSAGMRIQWAAPRQVVAAARHRPRFLARGRFQLEFAYGSWIVLSNWPPNIGSWHAKRVVEALASHR